MASSLISCQELAWRLSDPLLRIVDCRFELLDAGAGPRAYQVEHLPGAIYIDLEQHLSGEKTGINGRHPLPKPEVFTRALAQHGIAPMHHVVAYDNSGGCFAARLWWLLRWIGHANVQVLDGGWAQWVAGGFPVSAAASSAVVTHYPPPASVQATATAEELMADQGLKRLLVVDARSPQRFRGEGETMDPVAGHIPGARNRFFMDNLQSDGCFKSAESLRAEWLAVFNGYPVAQTVQQCGSGVTACHNLLALDSAGFSGARLYPGSWSEWCTDGSRPVVRG